MAVVLDVPGVRDPVDLSGVPTERLEADICELAAHLDAALCRWLGLVAEFDRREGWAGWECLSCAMWLSWKCGISLTTAHEQVRVARALEGLAVIRAVFGRGELSYSKVRAMTRIATPAIEAELVEIAREQTGAGLERICRAYRRHGQLRADGDAVGAFEERALTWCHDEGGAFVFHGRLPAELGELVVQMIEHARGELAATERAEPAATGRAEPAAAGRAEPAAAGRAGRGDSPAQDAADEACPSSAEKSGDAGSGRREPPEPMAARRADALVHAARSYLGLLDEPRRRAAGAEVTVLVDAELLAGDAGAGAGPAREPDEPVGEPHRTAEATPGGAGTTERTSRTTAEQAGTDRGAGGEGRCETGTGAGLAPSVARRLACDGVIRPLVLGVDGEPLRLGRRRRVVTAALRHALEVRDRCCRFPGCDRRGWLDAHHLVHWADGGVTDIDNLALLCGHHHRRLHEGGWSLTRDALGQFHAHGPDGTRYDTVPVPIDPTNRIEAIHERLGLTINARTNESLWEGPGGDLSAVIEYLAHLDHHDLDTN